MSVPTVDRSTQTGILLAVGTALISGFAVFVNGFAVKQFPDPATFTTLKNAVAAVILVAAAMAAGGLPRGLGRRRWMGLAVLGLIGGSVPFLLFFNGLALAGSPTAAIIHKTLFIWVALLGVVVLQERIGAWQVGALGVLLVAHLMIQPPDGVGAGSGELLIAAATLFWAVETILARRLLASVPALVAGAARMGFGLIVLVGYLALSGRLGAVAGLGTEQWAWVLGTGVLLAGYVASWYGALQRAPAAAVAAVLTLGAPVTATLQWLSTGAPPAPEPLFGYVLIMAAAGVTALALSGALRSRRPVPVEAA